MPKTTAELIASYKTIFWAHILPTLLFSIFWKQPIYFLRVPHPTPALGDSGRVLHPAVGRTMSWWDFYSHETFIVLKIVYSAKQTHFLGKIESWRQSRNTINTGTRVEAAGAPSLYSRLSRICCSWLIILTTGERKNNKNLKEEIFSLMDEDETSLCCA